MVTISKDGTWRLYDTQVEYEQGQEPYFLLSNQYNKSDIRPVIALSPDGRTIVVGIGPDLTFYSAVTGESLYSINNITLDHIKDVKFEPSSKYLVTLGDKHPKVFINVAGYQTLIQDLERSKSKSQTSAMKERITAQIQEAKICPKRTKYDNPSVLDTVTVLLARPLHKEAIHEQI
ncbi:Transducin beta-like protein 2 [Armadillidium vulgare]|nr:Transducin beta-like protein 2 [Armadillidium vulgare]